MLNGNNGGHRCGSQAHCAKYSQQRHRFTHFVAGLLTTGLLVVGTGLLLSMPAAHAQSTSLLTNGNFETGNFNGWTVANVRDPSDTGTGENTRNFFIDTPGSTTPTAGGPYFTSAPNANGGNDYAVSANNIPGASALFQAFTTPTIASGQGLKLTFTFDLFVNDQSGYSNTHSSGTLDYTAGGTFMDNQYARVDLLRFSSGDFSTDSSDVLFNVPLNVPVTDLNDNLYDNPNPYKRYSVDLSPYVTAGTQYKIRFAEVNNLSALNIGVDNVGVTADITPEPATVGLMLPIVGIAPVYLLRSRRKAKKS